MTDTPQDQVDTPKVSAQWAYCPGDCKLPRLVVGLTSRRGPRIRVHDERQPSQHPGPKLGQCNGSGRPVPRDLCRPV
jgi:hypothetical protein